MPSETASSASPRYRRTLGTSSTSGSSRQSRIASAISVGVISSSPASSATALISAIALRIRTAALPPAPLLVSWLARSHDDPPLGFFADARAGHVGIALEREVDRSALERLHRIERDCVACHLHLARSAHRNLAHRVLAPLPVALDVDDDAFALGEMPADHHVGDGLQGAKGFAPPSDQRAEVAPADVESDRVGPGPDADLRTDAHVFEQTFDQDTRRFGLAVGCGRRRRGCGAALLQDAALADRLLLRLAADLDVDVAAALLEFDQRRVNGLVEGAAPPFCRFHVRLLLGLWLGFLVLLEVAGGGAFCAVGGRALRLPGGPF